MSYTALYRKWRPVEFDDVKGQNHIVQTLKNQITSGRIGHAYLFAAPAEPARLPLQRSLPKRLTVSIR